MDKVSVYEYYSDNDNDEGGEGEGGNNYQLSDIGGNISIGTNNNNNNNTSSYPRLPPSNIRPQPTAFRKIETPISLGPTQEWKDKFSNKQPTRFDGSTQPYNWKDTNWGPDYYEQLREKEELLKLHPLYKFYKVLTALINERSGGIKGLSLDPFDMTSQEERYLRSMLRQRNLFQLTPENLILERTKLEKIRNEANIEIQRVKRQNVSVMDGMKIFKEAMIRNNIRGKMIYNFFLDALKTLGEPTTSSYSYTPEKLRDVLDKYIIVLNDKEFRGVDVERYVYDICKFARTELSGGRVPIESNYTLAKIMTFMRDFVSTMNIKELNDNVKFDYNDYTYIFKEIQKLIGSLTSFKGSDSISSITKSDTDSGILYGDSEVISSFISPVIFDRPGRNVTMLTYFKDNPEVKKAYEDFVRLWNVHEEINMYISYQIERIYNEDRKLSQGGKNLRNLDIVWEKFYVEEKRRIESTLSSTGDSIAWISKRLQDISSGNLDVSGGNSKYYPTFETMMSSYNTGVINLGPVEGHIQSVFHTLRENFPKYIRGKEWTDLVTSDDDYVPFAKLVAESFHNARVNNPTTYITANQTGLVNKNRSDPYAYFRKKEKGAYEGSIFKLF